MAKFSTSHNGLIDAHNQLNEDMKLIAAKLADLEDRNRQNNIKLRGIPELVSNSDIVPCIQQMMNTPQIGNDLPQRCYHMSALLPHQRGVVASNKKKTSTSCTIPKSETFCIFVSIYHSGSKTLTDSILCQHNILYKWGFPTKVLLMSSEQSKMELQHSEALV